MTTTNATDRFTELPDDQTIADTVVALEEHGFSVEVVDDLDAARETRPRADPRRLLRHDQPLGDAAGDRDQRRDRRRWTVRLSAQQAERARLRNAAARDEEDRRPARLLPRQRPRNHPRGSSFHCFGIR